MTRSLSSDRAAPARGRLRLLDGLRFSAAIAVLGYHYAAFDKVEGPVWGQPVEDATARAGVWFGYGALAPYLFFVISGFVILMTAEGRGWRYFIASRVARLYPAYWAAVLATSALLLLMWNPGRAPGLGQIAMNLTMVQAAFEVPHVDGVYWTLWVELKFYLLMGIFVVVGLTARRVVWFAGLWPLAGWALAESGLPWLWDWLIYRHAPFFAGGMLLYLLYSRGHTPVRWLLLIGNAALAVWHTVPGLSDQVAQNTPYALEPRLLGALVVGCFVAVALIALTRWSRVEWRWLTTAGVLTYPVYLLHQYWGWWVIAGLRDHVGPVVSVTAATAVSLTLAWLVHRCVERPIGPRMKRAVLRALGGEAPGR
ncbi:acyltransferase family protein [Ruania halotolerans]|uniref:acyltransferase family protein n=1 Tax=Ruania halotolerans TaxID=2897773 RepID=UPI001E360FA1|nr:acyltransferase [Ruania halotolerans]UFU07526.1 acyltransferase [Ruania halotolerans]